MLCLIKCEGKIMTKKILLIEDDENLIKSLTDFMEKEDFEITFAINGEEGILKAKSIKPDLIILDIILPKKNGFTVLEELKKDEGLKNIPVIILTNLEEEKDIEKALSLGAYTYLVKANYSLDEILKKIKEILEK